MNKLQKLIYGYEMLNNSNKLGNFTQKENKLKQTISKKLLLLLMGMQKAMLAQKGGNKLSSLMKK